MYISREKLFSASKKLQGIEERNKAASVEDILTVDYKKNKKELSNGGFEGKTLMPFVLVKCIKKSQKNSYKVCKNSFDSF